MAAPAKHPKIIHPLKLYPGRWDLPESRPGYILDYTSWKILGVPESTAPAQDLPPFSCFDEVSLNPIYPSSTKLYVRPSQNLPLPPEYNPFPTTICDPCRIYPSLPGLYSGREESFCREDRI